MTWLALAAIALASWALTGYARRYALARALLDRPTHRSSHSRPTPRGGGVALVLVLLPAIAIAGAIGLLDRRIALALALGGALVAAVGWIDDRRTLSARVRALCHVAAAGLALWLAGGLPELRLAEQTVHVGIAGTLCGLLAIVWLTNLYNFMDGIDGLAGGEAVVVGAAAGGLLLAADARGLAFVAFGIAAAALGFLVWNWSPARIFMGDVGSATLGYLFGVLALASERAGALPAVVWLILLAPFWVDATITLVRRFVAGERWYEAHRSHAYQRAVQHGLSHARVSGLVIMLGIALAGMAWLAAERPAYALILLAGAVSGTLTLYLLVERLRPMRTEPHVAVRDRTAALERTSAVRPMRVLVTGAAGFVGSHLVPVLAARGHHVIGGVHRSLPREPLAGVEWHRFDLNDAASIAALVTAARPDAVVHLGAASSVRFSREQPMMAFDLNVRGSLALLDALARSPAPPRAVLLVGSAEAYGGVGSEPVAEEAPLRPTSAYGATKAALEMLGWPYGSHFRIVQTRSFMHTGPGQRPPAVIASWASRLNEIRRGEREPFLDVGDLTTRRDITDVRDVVRAYAMLLEDDGAHGVFNVCSGTCHVLGVVLEQLQSIMGVSAVLRPAATPGGEDMPVLIGDPSRLRTRTGWAPTLALDETLRDLVRALPATEPTLAGHAP